MKEANLNSSAPEPGMTLLSAAHVKNEKQGIEIKRIGRMTAVNKRNEG